VTIRRRTAGSMRCGRAVSRPRGTAVTRWFSCVCLALAATACTTQPRRPAPPAQSVEPSSVAALAAAIEADSTRSDHESDAKIRSELAAEADRDADACLSREPQAAACLYGRAVAFGLQARAHPTQAGEFLKKMLDTLASAESVDASYDEAGPARVRALVLVRAPGWPLGPGDSEAGLAAARRAVSLRPKYPPNLLALAEALAKTGDADGARESYQRAHDAAQALPAAADRDEWLSEAAQGLQHK
jgi:tetratricopeptide (TPR) repeat protein